MKKKQKLFKDILKQLNELYDADCKSLVDWNQWARLLAVKETGYMQDPKLTQRYIDGYGQFIKNLKKNMPFLKAVLPRIMKRDFFK